MQTHSVKEQGVKNHDTLPEGEYKFAPFLSFSFRFSPVAVVRGDDAQSRTAILHAVLAAAAEARFTGGRVQTSHLSLTDWRTLFFF